MILNDINIEWCIVLQNAEVIELHGFSNVSEKAYGAAIYARSVTAEGDVKLVTSRSRVSSIKRATKSRLEFSSRLTHQINV